MLGRYPLAIAPIAVLPSAGTIVESTMSTTASATVSWISAEVRLADASTSATATVLFDSQTVTVVDSDLASSPSLTSAFDSQTVTVVDSDATTAAALVTSFDGLARLMSSADASVTLALSPSFDSAFSTVIGSSFSCIINPPTGGINTWSVAAPGAGYTSTGIDLRVNGGDNNAIFRITGLSGGGVTYLTQISAGSGYIAGRYTTTRLNGAGGSGCEVNVNSVLVPLFGGPVIWRSGATKGVVATSTPALTVTPQSITFATAVSDTIAAVTADMVSGATAGVVATTTDAASTDWQGQAIGPVPADFSTVLACVASWSGQRLISTVKEDVRVGRTLTDFVNVGRSLTADVRVGE